MSDQQLKVEVKVMFTGGVLTFTTQTEKQAQLFLKKVQKEGHTFEKPTNGTTFRHSVWYPPQSIIQVEVLTSLKIQ